MFRKILFWVGMMGVLLSCNEQKPKEYIPKYDKFTNDLERENLIGKVKRVVHSKKKYRFYEFEDKTNDLILSDIDFNIYGNRVKALLNDENGVLKKRVQYKYSGNQRFRKWFAFYADSNSEKNSWNHVYQIYDSLGNRLYGQGYFCCRWCTSKITYDSMKNIIKEFSNGIDWDNHIRQFKNFYNSNGQLSRRITYDTNWDGALENIENYQYDKNGRLIEKTVNSDWANSEKIILRYDEKGRKTKYIKYDRDKVDTIFEYDIYANPIKAIFVEYRYDSKPEIIEEKYKYEYVYDYYGNWVVKKIYSNEGMSNGGYWLKDIENRKFEYYK